MTTVDYSDFWSWKSMLKYGTRYHVPTNRELEAYLDIGKDGLTQARMDASGLNSLGKNILKDMDMVLQSLNRVIEVNHDERIQHLFREMQSLLQDIESDDSNKLGYNDETLLEMKGQLNDMLQTIRLLMMELAMPRDDSFHNMLTDSMDIFRRILELTKPLPTASSQPTRPPQEQAQHISTAPAVEKRTVWVEGENQILEEYKQVSQSEISCTEKSACGAAASSAPVLSTSRQPQQQQQLSSEAVASQTQQEDIDNLARDIQRILRTLATHESTSRLIFGLSRFASFFVQVQSSVNLINDPTLREYQTRHMREIKYYTQRSIELFSNGVTLDQLLHDVNYLVNDLGNNQIKLLLKDVKEYVFRMVRYPDLLDEPDSFNDCRRLLSTAFIGLRETGLRRHLASFLRNLRMLLEGIRNDPTLNRLQRDLRKLFSDIFLDDSGRFMLNTNAIFQMKRIAMSYLEAHPIAIPLPRLHYEDDDWNVLISDATVMLRDILPENFLAESYSSLAVGIKSFQHNKSQGWLRFVMDKVQVYVPDSVIFFQHKTFPKTTDQGHAFMRTSGRGISLSIVLNVATSPSLKRGLFEVSSVVCDVHSLKIKLSDTRHNGLYNFALGLAKTRIRKQMEHGIEDSVRSMIDNLLIGVQQRMQKSLNANVMTQLRPTSIARKVLQPMPSSTSGGSRSSVAAA